MTRRIRRRRDCRRERVFGAGGARGRTLRRLERPRRARLARDSVLAGLRRVVPRQALAVDALVTQRRRRRVARAVLALRRARRRPQVRRASDALLARNGAR